jgi:hypothetical protein
MACASYPSVLSHVRTACPGVLATEARYAASVAVVTALMAMATALVAGSAGISGAAVVIANRARSVVDVFDDGPLWWRSAASSMSVSVRVATRVHRSLAYIKHML